MNMYVWQYNNSKLNSNFNQDNFTALFSNKKEADNIWFTIKSELEKIKGDKKILIKSIKNNKLIFTNNITEKDLLGYINNKISSKYLNIIYDDKTKKSHPNIEFRFVTGNKPEVFEDKTVQHIIEQIDGSKHIKGNVFESIYGTITSDKFSTGCKTMLLYYLEPEYIINLSKCGDNCSRIFTEITKQRLSKNIPCIVQVQHCFKFEDSIFPIYSRYSNKVLNNYMDFLIDYDNWSSNYYGE